MAEVINDFFVWLHGRPDKKSLGKSKFKSKSACITVRVDGKFCSNYSQYCVAPVNLVRWAGWGAGTMLEQWYVYSNSCSWSPCESFLSLIPFTCTQMKEIALSIQYSYSLFTFYLSLSLSLSSSHSTAFLPPPLRTPQWWDEVSVPPTCHFDVVWSNCWSGFAAIADEYKLRVKQHAAQGHLGGSFQNVVSLFIQ